MAEGGPQSAPFSRCVFLNCPYDDTYLPLLHAIVFTIHDCGFIARYAAETTGTGETRLDKIVRIVDESRFSIHDISRVEIDQESPLPRFNMPFECGLAVGAERFGPARRGRRDYLLLAAVPFQDKRTLSDLQGQDPKYHNNEVPRAINAVRTFLASKEQEFARAQPHRVRGGAAIHNRLEEFQAALPAAARNAEVSEDEIKSLDYIVDWLRLAVLWMAKQP